MAFDLATAKPDQPEQQKSSGGFDLSTAKPEKEQKPSVWDRTKEVAKEAGVGGVAGYFAPELLQGAGMLSLATPITAPAAPFLQAAGTAMRGARGASALAGALGGAGGEATGQVLEAKGYPKLAEFGRFAGSIAAPETGRIIGTPIGKAVTSILSHVVPGMKTAKTVGQLLQEQGIAESSLSAEQKAFLEKKIADIRGGQPSLEAQKEVFNFLERGAKDITGKAEQQVFRSQSEFNSWANTERNKAEQDAQALLKQAKERAAANNARVANADATSKQLTDLETKSMLDSAEQQAAQIRNQANQKIEQAKRIMGKVEQKVAPLSGEAKAAQAKVGQPMLPTDVGVGIQKKVKSIFDKLAATRKQEADKAFGNFMSAALSKEQQGIKLQDTKAYKDAIPAIKKELVNKETNTANVTVDETVKQLQKVAQMIRGRMITQTVNGEEVQKLIPSNFQALETLRRFLGDRASGLPAEGFDAIGQQQAIRLKKIVEDIQEEFMPGFRKEAVGKYAELSKPLEDFKTRLGKSVVGTEKFDAGRFVSDPASIGGKVFSSRTSFDDLVKMAGGNATEMEGLARGHFAQMLAQGKSPEAILKESADVLSHPQMVALRSDLENAVRVGQRTGSRQASADTLMKALGQKTIPNLKKRVLEAGEIVPAAQQEAQKAMGVAEQAGEKATKLTEAENKQLLSDAESAAGKVKKEAETAIGERGTAVKAEQAAITKPAQEKANLILGKAAPAERVRDFILSGNREEWNAIGELIRSNQQAKEKFGEAVNQVIADSASSGLKSTITKMKYIGDHLVEQGLMSPKDVQALQSKLQEIFIMPVSQQQKTTFAQRAVKDAMVGYVAPGAERVVEGGYKRLTK